MLQSFKKLNLYFNTIKYLKPIQIFGRIWFLLHRPKVSTGLLGLKLDEMEGVWKTTPNKEKQWSKKDEEIIFHSMNRSYFYNIDFWKDHSVSDLQLYHRHYFEDLRNHDDGIYVKLMDDWIERNPIAIKPAWDPYPTSLRIVNWITYHFRTKGLSKRQITSLAEQARYLQKRFEVHLQGNHLFTNGKASVFAGCFFKGKEADEWLKRGLDLLRTEIKEQVLDDGMHYEMSPMYHAIFLLDLLDLINLSYSYKSKISKVDQQFWKDTVTRMYKALKVVSHPDEKIALFGDSVLNATPDLKSIHSYAEQLGLQISDKLKSIEVLSKSLYSRLSIGDVVLIIKAGPLGPDHLLGHAHADTLTFELSYKGERLVVDSGVDRYGACSERLEQRGTSAHNTVVVDDRNSSEIWSSFRVANRAYPLQTKSFSNGDEEIGFSCGHNGYRRLSPPVNHIRSFHLSDRSLRILDRFQTKGKHKYSWHLYTKSPIKVVVRDEVIEPNPSTLYPEFGVQESGYQYYWECWDGKTEIESSIRFE